MSYTISNDDGVYKMLFQKFNFDMALHLACEFAKYKLEKNIDRMGFYVYLNVEGIPSLSFDKWVRLCKEVGMIPVYREIKHRNDNLHAMIDNEVLKKEFEAIEKPTI